MIAVSGDNRALIQPITEDKIVGDRIERVGDGGENVARRDRLDKKIK